MYQGAKQALSLDEPRTRFVDARQMTGPYVIGWTPDSAFREPSFVLDHGLDLPGHVVILHWIQRWPLVIRGIEFGCLSDGRMHRLDEYLGCLRHSTVGVGVSKRHIYSLLCVWLLKIETSLLAELIVAILHPQPVAMAGTMFDTLLDEAASRLPVIGAGFVAVFTVWLLQTCFQVDPLADVPVIGKGNKNARRKQYASGGAWELYEEGYKKV